MALIKCPECGKEVSDKAVSCVNCGYPIREFLLQEQEPEANNKTFEHNNTETVSESSIREDNESARIYKNRDRLLQIIKTSKKSYTMDRFFELLFECACLESEAIGETGYDFALALFAACDICISHEKKYDKYASRDWLDNNVEKYRDRLSMDFTFLCISRYEKFRYEEISYREDSGEMSFGFICIDYAYDVFRSAKYWLFTNSDEFSHSLSKDEVQMLQNYIAGLGFTISRVVDVFNSVDLINDYKRKKKPTPADYDLPDDIQKKATQIINSEYTNIKMKRIFACYGLIAAFAALAYYGNSIDNMFLLGAPIILLSIGGVPLLFYPLVKVERNDVVDSLKKNNAQMRRYFDYSRHAEEHKKKYPDVYSQETFKDSNPTIQEQDVVQKYSTHIIGENVKHKKYGAGTIIGIVDKENVIYIDFSGDVKSFTLDCIDNFLV